jgi:hypothetical protein
MVALSRREDGMEWDDALPRLGVTRSLRLVDEAADSDV